jgi:dolichol-phosphate mannosyltransferase
MRTVAGRLVGAIVCAAQIALAARVVLRMAKSASGKRISAVAQRTEAGGVAIVVPVLNEAARLGPCLDGALAQGATVSDILVVDGGSSDGTRDLVARYAERDTRVRLIDASPVPSAWNGKAWGLERGRRALGPDVRWFLGLDADVRPTPALADALLVFAETEKLDALSVATRQRLSDLGDALLHPAMLATLVYRFGIPGNRARGVDDVQANGQCFFVKRDALDASDAFDRARDSRCEDVTTARVLVRAGKRVGFYESDDLIDVAMYANWRETLLNWPRSLPMIDRFTRAGGVLGLLEVVLVQALPLPLLLATTALSADDALVRIIRVVNGVLFVTRLGTLVGTSRAYRTVPLAYWFSPLADALVAGLLVTSAARRRHTWRGRPLVLGSSS